MSNHRFSLLLAVPLATAGLLLTAPSDLTRGPELAAEPLDPFADSDGDLLADRLEWVLLLDPDSADTDQDGTDDFLHAVQGRLGLGDPRTSFGYDDEARVVVTEMPRETSGSAIWIHMMFRFAGANIRDLRSLSPYIDRWGQRMPIDQLLGSGGVHLVLRPHPTEGVYAICSFEIGDQRLFRSLLPCTVGATAVMGSRTIRTGAFLSDAAGELTTLVGVAPDSGVIQTLRPEGKDDPFWESNRVCVLRLAVVTTMPSGMLCEISDANCVSSGELACPPTCRDSRGHILFFPDGLSTITGGGH